MNAQSVLDAYEYIIVPRTFESLKEEDKYQVNSLAQFLFEKEGFKTLKEGEAFPGDLAQNPCSALHLSMLDDSNLFTTKVKLKLEDCQQQLVFESGEGKSKEKDYTKSYHEAFRNAFESVQELGYQYNPTLKNTQSTSSQLPAVVAAPTVLAQPEEVLQPQAPLQPEVVVTAIPEEEEKVASFAHTYANDNVSFMLIPKSNGYQAYITESKVDGLKPGEVIGDFQQTSLPNVFRVNWKNPEGKMESTTGYFDESGKLKIDVNKNGNIETVVFTKK
ncbi:hypothetical protein [Namhaeicola litoreus]|uniref:Uncharacterized protein n=1 Tax=Namhaeicola litoreus TaxID=1052145 RepID=A0ABW3Y7P8_9FLAO